MSKEFQFQSRLSQLRTRETSTLTIATVAASVSLLLFGLDPTKIMIDQKVFNYVGLLFVILGILYREITIWTIDRWDQKDIDGILGKKQESPFDRWRRRVGLIRGYGFRMFLLLPAYLWTLRMVGPSLEYLPIIFILIGLVLTTVEWKLTQQKKADTTKKPDKTIGNKSQHKEKSIRATVALFGVSSALLFGLVALILGGLTFEGFFLWEVLVWRIVQGLLVLFAISWAVVIFSIQRKQSVLDFRGNRIMTLELDLKNNPEQGESVYRIKDRSIKEVRDYEVVQRHHDVTVLHYFEKVGSGFSLLHLATLMTTSWYAIGLTLNPMPTAPSPLAYLALGLISGSISAISLTIIIFSGFSTILIENIEERKRLKHILFWRWQSLHRFFRWHEP